MSKTTLLLPQIVTSIESTREKAATTKSTPRAKAATQETVDNIAAPPTHAGAEEASLAHSPLARMSAGIAPSPMLTTPAMLGEPATGDETTSSDDDLDSDSYSISSGENGYVLECSSSTEVLTGITSTVPLTATVNVNTNVVVDNGLGPVKGYKDKHDGHHPVSDLKDKREGLRPVSGLKNKRDELRPGSVLKDKRDGLRPVSGLKEKRDELRPASGLKDKLRPVSRDIRAELRPVSRDKRAEPRPVSREKRAELRPVSGDKRAEPRPVSTDKRDGLRPASRDKQDGLRPASRDKQDGLRPVSRDKHDGLRPVSEDKRDGLRPVSGDKHDELRPVSVGGIDDLEATGSAEQKSRGGRKKEWMESQTKTFTNWFNDCLKCGKNDRKVEDLCTDLNDGILLIKLLENLTKMKVTGTNKVLKTEAHKIVNLDLAFKFMQKDEIKMIGVGAINVYQGDLTRILGMIWMLIQKYQIRIQGYKVSTKRVMILWVQALLPRMHITNLTTDWRDGRALIELINRVKPGIAPKVASLDPTKCHHNCSIAARTAQVHLKVPTIISLDDLCSGVVDELSMMTYLSYFVNPLRLRLLKTVRKMLPHSTISGFSTEWADGELFASLLDVCFPGQFHRLADQDSSSFMEDAFKVMTKKLGITTPFSAADLSTGNVEEVQVMTLVLIILEGELQSLPENVIISGPGLKEAHLQRETSFTISTSEAGPGQLFIDAYYEDDKKKLKFRVDDKKGKELRIVYTPVATGNIAFDILWSDKPVPLSPFIVPVADSMLVKIVDFESHSRQMNVGQPLQLTLDTTKAGKGTLTAYLQYNKKDKIQAVITPVSSNRFRLDYTPTKPGFPVLHTFWNKEELAHLSVEYTIVDSASYVVENYPKDKVFCTFEEVSFTVLSTKGLPHQVLLMTAILDDDYQIPITFQQVTGNKGYASFKPTMPGTYKVEVVCADSFIQGSPFMVNITDPHSCKIAGELPTHLQLGVPHVFEIDTKDAGVGSITFESTDHNVSSLFKTHFHPQGKGPLKLEVTPITEGDFVVGLKYHKEWIASCPFRLQVCDPKKLRLLENLTTANIGKPINFTIEAKKACSESLQPVITAAGPTAQYSPRVTLSEDLLFYNVNFIPWEIGEHEIAVQYGTFHIPKSPMKVSVVSFDPNSCTAAGAGLQRALTNTPSQFVVLGKQPGLIEDGTLSIKIASVMKGEECKVRVRDNKDGTYNVAYLIQKAGAYLIEVKTAGEHIPGSPFRLNALLGPDASKCTVHGPALEEKTILTFGKPIDFTVETAEAGNGKLTVKALGPDGKNARVFTARSDKKGQYDINIDALKHGKHRVSVKWSGQHIPNSPFMLKVFPGADASKCMAYGPGLEDGLVGKKSSFTIDTKNAGAGILKVRLHGLKGAFKIEIQPVDKTGRRTLLAKYDPRLPGEYLIKIMWSDAHVPGSPFRVKIAGDGSDAEPIVFTPTPRLPDPTTYMEDEEEEEEEDHNLGRKLSNPLKTVLQSAPAVMSTSKQPMKKGNSRPLGRQNTMPIKKKQPQRRRGGQRKQPKKKNEYDGQATIRIRNNPK